MVVAFFRAAPVEAAWPVENAKSSFVRKIASRWHGLWHGVEAAAENVRLRRDVAALEMVRHDNERLAADNDRMRRDLRFAAREPGMWEAAEVLSSGGGAATARNTIRIAKGSFDGVEAGAAVAVPSGLVGRVVSVTPHTADVLLVTDPTLQVSCRVSGSRPAVYGIANGESDSSLALKHVRAGSKIDAGAMLETSGMGGVFPDGITVGFFEGFSAPNGARGGNGAADGAALELEGRLRTAVDMSLLEDVFIRMIK